jgi:hypothetical protein
LDIKKTKKQKQMTKKEVSGSRRERVSQIILRGGTVARKKILQTFGVINQQMTRGSLGMKKPLVNRMEGITFEPEEPKASKPRKSTKKETYQEAEDSKGSGFYSQEKNPEELKVVKKNLQKQIVKKKNFFV